MSTKRNDKEKFVYSVQCCHSIDNYTIVFDGTMLFEAYEDAFEYCKTTIEEDYEYGLINDTIKDICLFYDNDDWTWREEAGAKRGNDLYVIIDDYDIVYVISTMIVH